MNKGFVIAVFLTFSNLCNAVLTRDHAYQLIEWILKDPLSAEIVFVGLLPCNRFEALVPAFDETNPTEPTQNLPKVKEVLLDLFKFLLKEIKYYPKNYVDFKNQSSENKKLYRVTSTVFCFLIMLKVTLEIFKSPAVEKDTNDLMLRKLNNLFEKDINLVPFLKLFPIVLYHFILMIMLSPTEDIDKPEPQFCHWISKAALLILNNNSLRQLFLGNSPISNRFIFIQELIKMETAGRQILKLFVYSCKQISGIDQDQSLYPTPDTVIVFKPTSPSQSRPALPVIEPPLECSELEKSLTIKSSNVNTQNNPRKKKNRNKNRRAPMPIIQPTLYDGPAMSLETEQGAHLFYLKDYGQRDKVIEKRSNSAPPKVRGVSEPFKINITLTNDRPLNRCKTE